MMPETDQRRKAAVRMHGGRQSMCYSCVPAFPPFLDTATQPLYDVEYLSTFSHAPTNEPQRSARIWTILVVGAVYAVVGIVIARLAGAAASSHMRVIWRLSAWAISGIAFATHIGYELFRLKRSRTGSALDASLAVGVGAFALAAAANLHRYRSAPGADHSLSINLALVSWPLLTGIPAFLVALALGWAFGLVRSSVDNSRLPSGRDGVRS